jgi:hypothetical protein
MAIKRRHNGVLQAMPSPLVKDDIQYVFAVCILHFKIVNAVYIDIAPFFNAELSRPRSSRFKWLHLQPLVEHRRQRKYAA